MSEKEKSILSGYVGRALRVDLTDQKTDEEQIDPQVLRDYVGGTGLGARILFDEVPAGVDAYDPQNRLIFATGPLTGTAAPGSGSYAVVSRSPLTGLACSAQANGFFGAYLKFAGYDGIIIQGASKKPVYLFISPGNVKIRDAAHLMGTDAFDTEERLKEELNLPKARVACIGISGENLVRFAAVCSDRGHRRFQ